jgi:putative N6-adenine-specific DNA methylase
LSVRSYFSVSSFVRNETIRDHRFANLKVKDAIVDRMNAIYSKRPNSGSSQEQAVIFLHWKGEDAGIYLDTSGESIAKHGYRKVTVQAPMQESLAAAIIRSTRWSVEQPFINPMCGSGTLAIETAMIRAGKAPGLLRNNFGFMHVRGFSVELWEQMRTTARKQTLTAEQQHKSTTKSIIATDQDARAIRAAQELTLKAKASRVLLWLY